MKISSSHGEYEIHAKIWFILVGLGIAFIAGAVIAYVNSMNYCVNAAVKILQKLGLDNIILDKIYERIGTLG